MFRLADRWYWMIPVAVWTAAVLVSLGFSLQQTGEAAWMTARQQGRDIFRMVEAMRLWNAQVGGLFVRQSEAIPPNSFLDLPDRDVVTTSGIQLTTVNPAYMTRQMAGVIDKETGLRIHITSLRPINPGNAADSWETAALKAFEQGAERERSEIVHGDDGENTVIRYMAPLRVRESCMKCHEKQGYRVGDVRGGISVSIPANDFSANLASERQNHIGVHFVVWLVVSLMLMFYLRQNRQQWNGLKALTATLEDRVAERTENLEKETAAHRASEADARRSEQRFVDLVNTTDGIVWEADAQTFVFTFVSRKAETLLGYPVDDWRKPGFWVDHLHPDDREWAPQYCASCTGRLEPHRFEYRFIAADGRVVWLEDIVTVVSESGVPSLLRGLMVDITARKTAEAEVRQLTQRLTLATHAAHIGIWDYEPESGKVVWDDTMYDIFGVVRDAFSGRAEDVSRLIHPDDVGLVKSLIAETLGTGSEFVTTFRIRRGDEIRHVDAHAVVLPGDTLHPARMIGTNSDVTERKRNEQELVRLATTDPLTGCYNRSYLQRALENEVDRGRRYGDPVSVIMYDLDNFKHINDTCGHDTGDQVLGHTAGVIRDTVRRTDVLARWGGEEFMVLCPRTSSAEAAVLAERLREALQRRAAPATGVVTASFGVATLGTDEGIDTLLKRADECMYRAKEAGRDRVCTDTEPA